MTPRDPCPSPPHKIGAGPAQPLQAEMRALLTEARLSGAEQQLALNRDREQAAFEAGRRAGRAAWPVALILGALSGAGAMALYAWLL